MADGKEQGCPNCERWQAAFNELKRELDAMKARVAELEAQLAKAKKHSGNSSKPPSSDITSPAKKKKSAKQDKCKRGGQPGHERHERKPFAQNEIDDFLEYRYDACPCCGGSLKDNQEPVKILQQVELDELPLHVTEHQSLGQQCTRCHKIHYKPFPEELVKAGLVGPRLTALVGYLKGACHMSFSSIRKFFRDVVGVQISRGQLAKLIRKVSESLQDPYEELLRLLPEERILNVDETGHKDNGKRLWTWCFRASLYTLFKISPSRGSDVLIEVLGEEFNGVLGCDYFSAYRKYMKDCNVLVQFCLAHFIRDIKFLAEHPNAKNRAYGKLLLEHLRKLFHIIHRRDQYPSEAGFRCALARVRNDLNCAVVFEAPETNEAWNIENRFREHLDSYFQFITTPGVEPTNNLAEQAIRFVAIHRRMTQGTRSESGQTWCERIWTIIQTCAQQGRSLFHFLGEAVTAFFKRQPAPSLVPDSS
jgi:transposase